ncbi:aspartic peptidase A1 [Collybia nuda]|uniref:Aspartic peptidase A1 n=1 Tax=Collybia nuda TaxID=64659 RepID=A0A9P6CNE1_9AGAR|nr:aspartic peptidase A1 [Collybia nuda]
MRGRTQVSDHELLSRIQKRASALSPLALHKRYYSVSGTPGPHSKIGIKPNHTKGQSLATDVDGGAPADGLTKANKPSFGNSIGLDIQAKDRGYVGTVKIGTPARNFRLLMDSGSADLWVGGEGCIAPDDGDCGNHNFLGPKTSSSFRDTNQTWSIEYGTGAVSGHVVTDNISIASLKLKSFKFGVAREETEDFTPDYIPFDGLAGLAKSMISQQGTITLVEALHKAGHIKDAITSYKIPRLADGKNDGEMTLGAMNPAKYNSKTLVTVPNVNPLGFWEAIIDGVKINGKDMGWKNRTAILDTGTTLIIAPEPDVAAIHKHIPGAYYDGNSWTVPCNTKAAISFTFGKREYSIDARDIPWLPIDPSLPKGNCSSGFSIGSIGADDQWLVRFEFTFSRMPLIRDISMKVGDIFLKNVYMSTDVGKNQITFAKLAK